jgi:hypothetical protein
MKAILFTGLIAASLVSDSQTFTLKSKELGGQASAKQVLNGMGCNGQNISPELSWDNAPAGTKSFAITIYDEDAPTGSGWWHWLVFDIDKSVGGVKSGAGNPAAGTAPAGAIQSRTDFGNPGYGGPCPPQGSGSHRYIVTVYALDAEKLGLDATANPPLVGFYLSQHTIEKASLIFYGKR